MYIDAHPYRPMVGRVESRMPGFYFVRINIGSRYRKGRTIPVPEQLLQSHKVHRLQIQAATGPLPELFKGTDSFPLFTDKPDRYPDFAHPSHRVAFGGSPPPPPAASEVPPPPVFDHDDKVRDFLTGAGHRQRRGTLGF